MTCQPPCVILYLEVRELCSLNVYIIIFVLLFLKKVFAHGPIGCEWFLERPIWSINGTQTGTTTSSQSGHGSNGSEEVFHTT